MNRKSVLTISVFYYFSIGYIKIYIYKSIDWIHFGIFSVIESMQISQWSEIIAWNTHINTTISMFYIVLCYSIQQFNLSCTKSICFFFAVVTGSPPEFLSWQKELHLTLDLKNKNEFRIYRWACELLFARLWCYKCSGLIAGLRTVGLLPSGTTNGVIGLRWYFGIGRFPWLLGPFGFSRGRPGPRFTRFTFGFIGDSYVWFVPLSWLLTAARAMSPIASRLNPPRLPRFDPRGRPRLAPRVGGLRYRLAKSSTKNVCELEFDRLSQSTTTFSPLDS